MMLILAATVNYRMTPAERACYPRDAPGETRPLARRAEKKQATRETLIRIARELFTAYGYDQTTVDDIVARAGVSQRTFFRYFPSKLDVAFPYHQQRTRQLDDLLSVHVDRDSPLLGIRRALDAFAVHYSASREALLAEFRYVTASKDLQVHDAELDGAYEQSIATALERAGIPPRRSRVLAGAVFGGIRATLFEWFTGGCKQELTRVSADLMDLVERLATR